jgi:predicted SprT family Zn-dependent metalloprotease
MKHALNSKTQGMVHKALQRIDTYNKDWFRTVSSITWLINTNMRRNLGLAHIRHNIIYLSGDYVANASDESLMDTITHELAHFIAWHHYKDRGHGWRWKSVHMALGGTASRTAKVGELNYKIRRNRVRKVVCEKNGREAVCSYGRWKRERVQILQAGYTYLRTVQIDNGVTTIIHERPRSSLFDVVAAQTVKG